MELKKHLVLPIFLFLVICFISSCSTDKNTNPVSEKIVFQIDNLKITEFEFLKNLDDYKVSLDNIESETKRKEAIDKWKEEYIENCYFIVDAIHKGYDTLSTINKNVEEVANYMLSKQDGFLWDYVATPQLEISDSVIEKAYEAMQTQYYVEQIVFLDTNYYKKYKQDDLLPTTKKKFENLAKNNIPDKIEHNLYPAYYPFTQYIPFTGVIDSLDKNEIAGPYNEDGYYFFFLLNKKEKTNLKSFNEEKEGIAKILKRHISSKIVYDKIKEVFDYAQPKIYYNNLNTFLALYKANEKNNTDSAVYNSPPLLLAKYTYKNQNKDLFSHQFYEQYSYALLKNQLNSLKHLEEEIRELIIQEYVSDQAKELGLDTTRRFVLEKRNFKNKLLINRYFEIDLGMKDKIDEDILKTYYEKTKNNYVGAEYIVLSLFDFETNENAKLSKHKITLAAQTGEAYKFKDKVYLQGLEKYEPSDTISRNSTEYPTTFINQLFQLPINECTDPIEENGHYTVGLKKSEYGAVIKPFDEVEGYVRYLVRKERSDKARSEKLATLKKSYNIKINELDGLL